MSEQKKPIAWTVTARYPSQKQASTCYTGNDKTYLLREVEELIDDGAAYINISALYMLFGSEDMSASDTAGESRE